MDTVSFSRSPVMGILRGIESSALRGVMEASVSAGLGAIEITMNTVDPEALIKEAVDLSGGRIPVGAGTVLSESDMERAVKAGASFIVMPVFIATVVRNCVSEGIPVFPGALTPQEVFTAWEAGATMVKVFPSGLFGPGYLKELLGPLDKVRLMSVGGVRQENVEDHFRCGASAVAVGGSVFTRERLATGNIDLIENDLKILVNKARKYSSS